MTIDFYYKLILFHIEVLKIVKDTDDTESENILAIPFSYICE